MRITNRAGIGVRMGLDYTTAQPEAASAWRLYLSYVDD